MSEYGIEDAKRDARRTSWRLLAFIEQQATKLQSARDFGDVVSIKWHKSMRTVAEQAATIADLQLGFDEMSDAASSRQVTIEQQAAEIEAYKPAGATIKRLMHENDALRAEIAMWLQAASEAVKP